MTPILKIQTDGRRQKLRRGDFSAWFRPFDELSTGIYGLRRGRPIDYARL
jgi:hypothetical protein